MTRVYCCNFMEQIYQWYKKNNWWSFSLYLMKLSLNMIGYKEQEPEPNGHAPQTFNRPY